MVFIHELDLLSAAALSIVLLILITGLRRRRRQRAKWQPPQLKDATTRSIVANGLTSRPPGDESSTHTKTVPKTHCSFVESRSSGPSPAKPSPEDIHRSQPVSPLCSGCQYSLTKCQCTIVLYRPANGVSPTTDSPISGPSQGSPRSRSGVSSTKSKSVLSPTVGATEKRSASKERTSNCRTSGAPFSGRFLTVERYRSRTSSQRLAVSGCDINSVKSNDTGRILESNANVVGFKSKMM